MRLNLAALKAKGWQVSVQGDYLTVYGDTQLPFVAEWIAGLREMGISAREAEYMVDDLAVAVEQKLIMRDGAD